MSNTRIQPKWWTFKATAYGRVERKRSFIALYGIFGLTKDGQIQGFTSNMNWSSNYTMLQSNDIATKRMKNIRSGSLGSGMVEIFLIRLTRRGTITIGKKDQMILTIDWQARQRKIASGKAKSFDWENIPFVLTGDTRK